MNKKTIALAGAGIVAASALALGGAALASADETGTAATTNGYGQGPKSGQQGMRMMGNGDTDPSQPMRSDEKLLTGDTAATVTAAAMAKEPGATIERVETDSDGVYEAHMVRADGTHITVQVDASFTVTGVQEGGPGGPGGRGPNGTGSGMAGGMGSGMRGDHDGAGAQPGESGQPNQPNGDATTAPSGT
jgi:hypothetical protein